MKKLVLCAGCLAIVTIAHAGSVVSILPSTSVSKNSSVSCSTTTATSIAASNIYRKGIAVKNNDVCLVRISTFAATTRATGYPIGVGEEFSDNVEPYFGDWYVISSGTSAATVDVIEKSGVISQ